MTRRLKVLYYNTFLPMNLGEGMVSRHFFAAATQLDGWQLTTIPAFSMETYLGKNGRNPRNTRLRGKVKHYIPASIRKAAQKLQSPISPIPIAPYLYARRMTQQIQTVIEQRAPFDAMLLHLSQQDLGSLAKLCSEAKTPIVLRVPGPLAYEADHVFHRHMSRRARESELFLYDVADAISVISEDMKQLLVSMGAEPSKIHPIPNGIDFESFVPDEVDNAIVRQQFGLGKRPVVGYVGGFWPGNDLDTLLMAWQKIEEQEPDAVLLLVGDGPRRPSAKALSMELGLKNCVWVGRVPHLEVPNYLSAMNVGVGPYIGEALAYVSPLKVIEYAAMGLPVVAANGGQITELIEHGVTGYTYKAGSMEQLANYVLDLLNVPDRAKEMGEKGRARMQRGWYSWDTVATDILSICENVAK